ncbi:MAG: metallophosphoesterase, partial [Tannerella sp.]|nr:metallophosphoesterase [Tannerella sp.]
MRKFYLVIILLCGLVAGYAQNEVRFAFLTDIHLTPGGASEANTARTVEEINNNGFDFTIVTGDLSNTGSDAELTAVKNVLDRLTKPYYIIPGNHETTWSESACMTFKKMWGDDM